MPARFQNTLFVVLLGATLFSCNTAPDANKKVDFLSANIDTTVSPSEDFFQYANGGWIKRTPIPEAESGWGIGNLVEEDIYLRLLKINEEAAADKAAKGTIRQKIGDFWFSGMDTVSIEQQKLKPLQPQFDAIDALANIEDIVTLTASLHRQGVNVMFSDYIAQDDKNSDAMAYQLVQGGLGMPNREYYFNTDARTVSIRKAYLAYLAKTLAQLNGDTSAAAKAASKVFALETRLAKYSRKLADLRDPYRNYHKMSTAAFAKMAPVMKWPDYWGQIGIKALDSVIVGQPEFYTNLSTELRKTSLDDWKNYLRFHVIRGNAQYLDSVTFNNNFQYRKTLTGASYPRPRWKRVLDMEENAMGEALGQLFVKEYFNEKTKDRYNKLVESIREVYKERILNLSWMTDSTKQRALAKLARMSKKVGFPDKWKDFSTMEITRGPLVVNAANANEWWHNYYVNKLGKPVDRTEWEMSPQTYNAYYNPANNEIVLPAGIFAVPGQRDEDLDDAFVYGYAAASTIGHEITHGFDDQGRQYDVSGNLQNWWQPTDETLFKDKAKLIIQQFSQFNPVDTLHINGEATQGENIADLGGMLLGLEAFKKTDAYKKNGKIGGFTQTQRYFLGYAHGWMYQQRKERLASLVMTDVHAPAKERVNGPVMNVPEFYEAFNVKPGSKMYLPDSLRVRIW